MTPPHRRVPSSNPASPRAARFAAQDAAEAAGSIRRTCYRVGHRRDRARDEPRQARRAGGEILDQPLSDLELRRDRDLIALDRGPGHAPTWRAHLATDIRRPAPGQRARRGAAPVGGLRHLLAARRGTVVAGEAAAEPRRDGRRRSRWSSRVFRLPWRARPFAETAWHVRITTPTARSRSSPTASGMDCRQAKPRRPRSEPWIRGKWRTSRSFLEDMHFGLRHTTRRRGCGGRDPSGRGTMKFSRRRQHRRRRSAGRAPFGTRYRSTARSGIRRGVSASTVTPGSADAIFVMHSDGLTSRWSLDDYPGLRMRAIRAWSPRCSIGISAASATTSTVVVGREARMNGHLLSVRLRQEHDVVARGSARGTSPRRSASTRIEQTRIATAVSELARNAFMYARRRHRRLRASRAHARRSS